ncbi:MAG: hypothetical protein HRT80_04955 [Henriciella sp.]|nr:hypothetical protein [Henriciella sp.]
MNKIIFCNALAFLAIPALWTAPFAAPNLLEAPFQPGNISWTLFAFVGAAIIGAVAAIIWEMKSD